MRSPVTTLTIAAAIATLANFVAAAPALAQPLSGSYTINNALATGGTNFADFGAAFTALETNGISAAVTFEVFDDGGNYNADLTYGLGVSDNGLFDAQVSGMGSFPIVFQAAVGESPVITGALFATGVNSDVVCVYINCPADITIEGISFNGGDTACLYCGCLYQPLTSISNLTIRRCTFSNCSGGPGLAVRNVTGTAMSNVTIENNFLFGNAGDGSGGQIDNDCLASMGVIGYGATTIVRHNTILHSSTNANTGAIGLRDDPSGTPIGVMSFNIFIVAATGNFCINDRNGNGSPPTSADYNVYYALPGALFHRNTPLYPDLAAWQTSTGLDGNSVDTNPNLGNITVGSENLHLTAGSTNALHRAIGSTVTDDIDGDFRPFGTARDIGADEHTFGSTPEIDVQRPFGTSIADAGTDAQGNRGVGVNFDLTYTIFNQGLVNLTLTGPNPVTTANDVNVTSSVLAQPTSLVLAPSQAVTFEVRYNVASAIAFSFDIDIASDDPNENPYDIAVSGTGTTAAAITVERGPAPTTIANGGIDVVGNFPAGVIQSLVYTIRNNGAVALDLTGTPTVQTGTPTNCSIVVAAPPTTPVAAGGTTTFTLNLTPGEAGSFNVAITIPNSDATANPYTIIITGTSTGSSSGGSGGGCTITADANAGRGGALTAMIAMSCLLVVAAACRMRRRRGALPRGC